MGGNNLADHVRMLIAPVQDSGAGAGRVGIIAGNICVQIWSGLQEKDTAQLPSAHERVLKTIEVRGELAALARMELVDTGVDPALTTRAIEVSVIKLDGCKGIGRDLSDIAAVFPGESR